MESKVDKASKDLEGHSAFTCETCDKTYRHDEAAILKWACCGHKMTRLEVLYESGASPTGA